MDTLAHPITKQRDHRHEKQHQRPGKSTQHLLVQGDDCYPPLAPKIFGIIFREAIDQKLQFGGSRLMLNARLKLYETPANNRADPHSAYPAGTRPSRPR